MTEETKTELLDRAKELDITGRSTMTRDELDEAVTEAEDGDDTNVEITGPVERKNPLDGDESGPDVARFIQGEGGTVNTSMDR